MLNLLPPTLLFLEVSLLKVFFSAVVDHFGRLKQCKIFHLCGEGLDEVDLGILQ